MSVHNQKNKQADHNSKAAADPLVQKKKNPAQESLFTDNRTEVAQLHALQDGMKTSADLPAQRKENKTGLPDNLKTGIENLSGHSMSDVKVHYNSPKPAQLNAHAYAQGTQIHIASGQEKHLAHEAWHVVQQKQGRVRPTKQLKAAVPVNDDPALEKEADVMGAKALSTVQRFEKSRLSHSYSDPSSHPDTIQRVVNINAVLMTNANVAGLNPAHFAGELGGVPIAKVRVILTSWIALDAIKNYNTNAEAVQAAAAAVGGYDDFTQENPQEIGGGDIMHMNDGTIEEYDGAQFTEDDRIALFHLLGRDNFEALAENQYLVPLHLIYAAHGIQSVARLATVGHFNVLLAALVNLQNFDALIGNVSEARLVTLIDTVTIAEMNTLFANATPQHVQLLSAGVSCELATKTAAQIAGIEAQWAGLFPWLGSVGSLNLLLAITGAGYTYAQCSTLAAHHLSAQEARTLQQSVLNFAILDAFITEGRRYRLTPADMIGIAQANVNAAYLVLEGAIRGGALNLIGKENNFHAWVHAVDNLMVDLNYALAVSGSYLLAGNNVTYERTVTVRNAAAAAVDTFVIHYHPNAAQAQVGHPNASPRHIKPVRGNLMTPRLTWDQIPANVLAPLPFHH